MLLRVYFGETNRTISIEGQLHGPDNCKSEKIGIKFRGDNCTKIFNPKTQAISPIETTAQFYFDCAVRLICPPEIIPKI